MAGFSTYLENNIVDFWLRNVDGTPPPSVYLALFTADPTDAGLMTNEVTQATNSYVRKPIQFDVPSGGVSSNSSNANFLDMPGVTVTHWGIFDNLAYQAGNMLYSDALTASVSPAAGEAVSLSAGQLTITHT